MEEATAAKGGAGTKGADTPTPTYIASKYRVVRVLGEGASGIVYLCEHTALEKLVAVKVLHQELADNPDLVVRFQREAQTAARLDHPNSVHVMDFGQDSEGTLYLAMEYIEGRDLSQLLDDGDPLDDERVVHIMNGILSALSAAHALGIVHRDLKPENVMFRCAEAGSFELDTVKVCDFGVAQFSPIRVARTNGATPDTSESPRVTGEGMVVGTPWYMSPEQARAETLDARSDIYSAGVVLFQLLTRTLPFLADDIMAVAIMHCTTPPPPPSGYGPVHRGLEAVCLKALSKTREARYQSATEMLDALRDAMHEPRRSRSLARISVFPGDKLARTSVIPGQALARLPESTQSAHAVTELAVPAVRLPAKLRTLRPSIWITGSALTLIALASAPYAWNSRSSVGASTISISAARGEVPGGTISSLVASSTVEALSPEALLASFNIENDPELGNSALWPFERSGHTNADYQCKQLGSPEALAAHEPVEMAPKAEPPSNAAPVPKQPRTAETPSLPTARRADSSSVKSDAHQAGVTLPTLEQPAKPESNSPSESAKSTPSKSAPAIKAETIPATEAAGDAPGQSPVQDIAASDSAIEPEQPPLSLVSETKPTATPVAAVTQVVPPSQKHSPITAVAVVAQKVPSGTSRSSLRSALNQGSITHCYQQAEQLQPNRELAAATLEISTNTSGRIVSAEVRDGEVPTGLRECLVQVARTGRIRNGEGGEVKASFRLQPER